MMLLRLLRLKSELVWFATAFAAPTDPFQECPSIAERAYYAEEMLPALLRPEIILFHLRDSETSGGNDMEIDKEMDLLDDLQRATFA